MIGKTGRYRWFPIAGSLFIAVGLFLLSMMDVSEAEGYYRLTAAGAEVFARLTDAGRAWLQIRLTDWQVAEDQGFAEAVDGMADQLIAGSRQLNTGRHAANV